MTAPRPTDDIRALCDAATPGPWDIDPWSLGDTINDARGRCLLDSDDGAVPVIASKADAAFIAAARTAVPDLLDRLAAVERERDEIIERRDYFWAQARRLRKERDELKARPTERVLLARAVAAEARLRDLTRRLGFGDGTTEPQADNDTIVSWFEERGNEAAEWVESQSWRDECARAGHDDCEDCWEHDPSLRLTAAEARLAAVEKLLVGAGIHGSLIARDDLRAALAAPSPQAEPATRCEHGYTAGHRRQRYDHMQGESVELPRCPGPQSTEETR